MEIVRIFVEGENGVWAIHLPAEPENEFDKFFNAISNVEWLHAFFEEHEADLHSGYFKNASVQNAILKVYDEGAAMENALFDYWRAGCSRAGGSLQQLFKPLNNYEYAVAVHQKSKGRLRSGWLRLYAIRLAANCFIVTGGAIKLTQHMRRGHLQRELQKLEITKGFLRRRGIDFPDDLNIHDND